MSKTFEQMLDELKIPYTCNMIEQFHQYYEILIEWNKVMNLTGITEYEDVLIKHFVDSVSIKKAVRMENVNTIIDIGTGAGFPGIPIKIVYPHIHVCLLDSLNKRIQFLNNVIETLGLKNIETIHGRAEDYAKQKQYREKYDLCVSRAVANLSSLSEYCLPYTQIGGRFVSYKSGDVDDEIKKSENAIKILGGSIKKIEKFVLPKTEIKRSLVVIEKERKTEKKYPRKAGMPTKEPL